MKDAVSEGRGRRGAGGPGPGRGAGAWAAGLVAAILSAGLSCAVAAESHPGFDGVWQVDPKYNLNGGADNLTGGDGMTPLDGKPIPFQPWSEALFRGASRSETEFHAPFPPNNQRCLVAGFVRATKGNFPWRLIETEDQVTFLFEEDGRVNIVPIKPDHAPGLKPSWYGDPIAHWEGDTLVIDVIGLNGKTPMPKAIFGTLQQHITHRIRLIDGGKHLEDVFTIDDPGAFTRPWQARTVFNRLPDTQRLRDYRCAENNRQLPKPLSWWGADWGPD